MKKSVEEELNRIIKKKKYKDANEIIWDYIAYHQVLSEDFIREFQDRLNWKDISKFSYLSKNFIIEFRDKLDLEEMLRKKKISQEFYNELKRPLTRFQLMDFE